MSSIKYYTIFNDGTLSNMGSGKRNVITRIVNDNAWVLEPSTNKYSQLRLADWKKMNPILMKHEPKALLSIIERNLKHSRQVSFILWRRDQLMMEVKYAAKFN